MNYSTVLFAFFCMNLSDLWMSDANYLYASTSFMVLFEINLLKTIFLNLQRTTLLNFCPYATTSPISEYRAKIRITFINFTDTESRQA